MPQATEKNVESVDNLKDLAIDAAHTCKVLMQHMHIRCAHMGSAIPLCAIYTLPVNAAVGIKSVFFSVFLFSAAME